MICTIIKKAGATLFSGLQADLDIDSCSATLRGDHFRFVRPETGLRAKIAFRSAPAGLG